MVGVFNAQVRVGSSGSDSICKRCKTDIQGNSRMPLGACIQQFPKARSNQQLPGQEVIIALLFLATTTTRSQGNLLHSSFHTNTLSTTLRDIHPPSSSSRVPYPSQHRQPLYPRPAVALESHTPSHLVIRPVSCQSHNPPFTMAELSTREKEIAVAAWRCFPADELPKVRTQPSLFPCPCPSSPSSRSFPHIGHVLG